MKMNGVWWLEAEGGFVVSFLFYSVENLLFVGKSEANKLFQFVEAFWNLNPIH